MRRNITAYGNRKNELSSDIFRRTFWTISHWEMVCWFPDFVLSANYCILTKMHILCFPWEERNFKISDRAMKLLYIYIDIDSLYHIDYIDYIDSLGNFVPFSLLLFPEAIIEAENSVFSNFWKLLIYLPVIPESLLVISENYFTNYKHLVWLFGSKKANINFLNLFQFEFNMLVYHLFYDLHVHIYNFINSSWDIST